MIYTRVLDQSEIDAGFPSRIIVRSYPLSKATEVAKIEFALGMIAQGLFSEYCVECGLPVVRKKNFFGSKTHCVCMHCGKVHKVRTGLEVFNIALTTFLMDALRDNQNVENLISTLSAHDRLSILCLYLGTDFKKAYETSTMEYITQAYESLGNMTKS